MAIEKGTEIGDAIVPDKDTKGTHHNKYQIGGYITVSSIAERDAIPVALRVQDKTYAKVNSDGLTYKLTGGIDNYCWQVDSASFEVAATISSISSNTNKRFVHVNSDIDNFNQPGLYYHDGLSLKFLLLI